ncbi:MAG: hypothetical protein LUC41_05150, partial [Clostridiales bacterium]|nr:hypothetical protein [Clostridiales bacterium]
MDDVFDLCINENNPICDDLRELYDSYGLLSHLYIFYQKGEITMVSISDKICSQENIDLAPHQAEYIDETYLLIDKCKRSEYVRLHGYKADKSQIDTLKRVGGVSRLLTAESKSRKSYDLTDEMIHILYDSGRIERNGISYIKTDVRLEKMILYQLLKMPKKPMLVIFTHENKFEMIKKRLHLLCR